ncbi:MAG TPA: hypothetical protein VKY29_04170 [Cryomorphaceae bacterium]|nr:hypothetical protein [Cryomorphaceae bacterium]
MATIITADTDRTSTAAAAKSFALPMRGWYSVVIALPSFSNALFSNSAARSAADINTTTVHSRRESVNQKPMITTAAIAIKWMGAGVSSRTNLQNPRKAYPKLRYLFSEYFFKSFISMLADFGRTPPLVECSSQS